MATNGGDNVIGGNGNDILASSEGADKLTGGMDRDIITEFGIGEDKINIHSMHLTQAQIAFSSYANGTGTVIGLDHQQ